MRTHTFASFVLGACAALAVSSVNAHGPQIQLTADNSKIVTRQLLPGNTYSSTNGLTAPASVYVMPVLPVTFNGNPVARVKPSNAETFGPGFTYGYDQSVVSPGARLFTAGLELHLEGLQIWNGSAFVDTGAGMEQLGVRNTSGNTLADSHKTIMGGDVHVPIAPTNILNGTYTADSHTSMRYQLLGDGLSETVASRDGVYLVSLELSGTQTMPSLMPSDTFYYILGKNVVYEDLTAVVNSFAASQGIGSNLVQFAPNVVPEPGTITLIAMSLLGISALPRRTRLLHGR